MVDIVIAIILAQALAPDQEVLPGPTPTTDVRDRVSDSVGTLCPDAVAQLHLAQSAGEISFWSEYVHHVIRCADEQKGMNQALLYTEAIGQIEGSILYLKPDANEASIWRNRAARLISKALPEAKSDPALVDLLLRMKDQLP